MSAIDHQYALNWNNYTSHLKTAFDSLLTANEFVDVTLSCEGKKISAHKMLLSACSTYFHDLFRDNPCQHPIVILRDVQFQDLKYLLTFMYSGEVNVPTGHLESFLKTGELLQISGIHGGQNFTVHTEIKQRKRNDKAKLLQHTKSILKRHSETAEEMAETSTPGGNDNANRSEEYVNKKLKLEEMDFGLITEIKQEKVEVLNTEPEQFSFDDPLSLDNVDLLQPSGSQRFEEAQDFLNVSRSPDSISNDSTISLQSVTEPEQKCELYHILNSSNEGKGLLLSYEENGLLDNTARRRLCNLIIANELKEEPDKRVRSSRFYQLADQITQIFKKESASVYFIPFVCVSPHQKTAAKGKLLDCFRQKRKDFVKSGVVKASDRRPCSTRSSSTDYASPRSCSRVSHSLDKLVDFNKSDVNETLLWLKDTCDPWLDVELFWSITSKRRFEMLSSENFTISQYFGQFKPLSQPAGLYLLLKDFERLYPEDDGKLLENWPLLRHKIIELAKKRPIAALKDILIDIDENDDEVLSTAAFMALPFLMATSTIRQPKFKEKKQWRPSKFEVLQGFITHVKNSAELEESIAQRKVKLTELGFTLQPYIIIVGPSIKSISARYIIINNVECGTTQDIRYELMSITKAVDACFKILFILNAEYPAECVNIWQFIQRGLFKISSKYDKIYTTVNTLLTDLRIEQYK